MSVPHSKKAKRNTKVVDDLSISLISIVRACMHAKKCMHACDPPLSTSSVIYGSSILIRHSEEFRERRKERRKKERKENRKRSGDWAICLSITWLDLSEEEEISSRKKRQVASLHLSFLSSVGFLFFVVAAIDLSLLVLLQFLFV
ncbi:hypothetical protein CSUI_008482 [Cystoisospora suis]|uniref:Transmembrane protein n=1 Tax=Cystoisospora suis TaxID=483139 RepID=A0A2C6KMK6_9APIC|nr:hypothetical protein CSUI_008482 [Cystoisospora suis]